MKNYTSNNTSNNKLNNNDFTNLELEAYEWSKSNKSTNSTNSKFTKSTNSNKSTESTKSKCTKSTKYREISRSRRSNSRSYSRSTSRSYSRDRSYSRSNSRSYSRSSDSTSSRYDSDDVPKEPFNPLNLAYHKYTKNTRDEVREMDRWKHDLYESDSERINYENKYKKYKSTKNLNEIKSITRKGWKSRAGGIYIPPDEESDDDLYTNYIPNHIYERPDPSYTLD